MRFPQTQKPPLGSQINWAHPLARGLVGCWLMNEGSGNKIWDSVKGRPGIAATGIPLWTGDGVGFSGASGNFNCGIIPMAGMQNFTVVGIFRVVVDSGELVLFSNQTYWTGSIKITYQSAYNRMSSSYLDDSGGYTAVVINAPGGIALNKNQFVVFSGGRSDLLSRFSQFSDTGMVTSTTASGFGIRNSPTTEQWSVGHINAIVSFCAIYDRVLSQNDVFALYQSPYAMFERRPVWMDYYGGSLSFQAKKRGFISGIYGDL
jgi:hypothetical protein